MPGPWWAVVLFYVGTFVLSGLGAGLAGYFKRRGENLATHDDLELVVDQVSKVTDTTKRIEAEISSGLWNKQKRWEMKREVLFEAAKRLSDLEQALLGLHSVLQLERKKAANPVPDPPEAMLLLERSKNKKLTRWSNASDAFDETTVLVNIVCSKDAYWALENLGAFLGKIAAQVSSGRDLDAYSKSVKERQVMGAKARHAIRNELEVDTDVKSESSKSSAATAKPRS